MIVKDKKIILHLLPSSICHQNSLSLIGKGVVISYEALFSEIEEIGEHTSGIVERLKISPACSLIQPYHQLIDLKKEKSNSQKTIGTTLRGIGPAYEDKVGRRAIRVVDTLSEDQLKPVLEETLDYYNFIIEKYFNEKPLSLIKLMDQNLSFGEKIKPGSIELEDTSNGKTFLIKDDGEGNLINSEFLNDLNIIEAKERIINDIERKKIGKKTISFRLKDWGISRQRYWGCPIPMIYLKDGSVVPVEKSELPVRLPEDVDLNSKGNPLENHPTWKKTTYKKTGETVSYTHLTLPTSDLV